jgi:superfamily II DNA or RNA helicase
MLSFVRRDPDKGYFGRQLWLPKKHINVRSVKSGLEFPVMDNEGITYLQLWHEEKDHLIVPREFFPRGEYAALSFPILSVQPTEFPRVAFMDRIELDAKRPDLTTQRDAWVPMKAAKSGLLNLACGKGKTIMALKLVAERKVPALVVVNNTTLIDQWQDRIREHMRRVPGGIGVLQGSPDTWDWDGRGICVAMIHSLSLHANNIPAGMDRYFGLVIYDEVHHLSAPLFVRTAPMFYGERHGLTATVNREDGLEPIYQYHIGDVYHSDLMPDMIPRIYFQECPATVDVKSKEAKNPETGIYDKQGKINIPKLRTYLGRLPECNEFIARKLRAPLEKGRKILVLSHSVEQLRLLNDMFADSGLCTGNEKPEARLRTLRTKQISFGTLQLVKEALDEDTLDLLYFLTPFGSSSVEDGGLNTLQQGMGRAQRFRENKKTPVIIILDHVFVPKMHKMCSTLKRLIRRWPKEQGGPLDYKILRPYGKEETK